MKVRSFCFILSFIFAFPTLFAQVDTMEVQKAQAYIATRGEVYFNFKVQQRNEIKTFTRVISIDVLKDNQIYAYANKAEFQKFLTFHIPFKVIVPASLQKRLESLKSGVLTNAWNTYPSYDQYVTMMDTFASHHRTICELIQFGTSVKGRKLLCMHISGNVNTKHSKPEFLYSSTIHGDEVNGYVLMLRLIDYLIVNYQHNALVTKLIDSVDVFINPLFNPDGTYFNGNSSVLGATRYNANNVDLNRNFPDPAYGLYPNGDRQLETQEMMDFMSQHNFVLAANFHGGSNVVNYPWDTWLSSEKTHADNEWYEFISQQYVDTTRKYGSVDYFTDVTPSGITEGGDWYVVNGGRQDYTNFYLHGREVTIELGEDKTPDASTLPVYWNYNYRSLLNFMEQTLMGIHGTVIDSSSRSPLRAKVAILNHDRDSSEVYSSESMGNYYRMVQPGTYDILFSANGYISRVVKSVVVTPNSSTQIDVSLKRDIDTINKKRDYDGTLFLKSMGRGASTQYNFAVGIPSEGWWKIEIFDVRGSYRGVCFQQYMLKGSYQLPVELNQLKPGVYIARLMNDNLYKACKFLIIK
jgi:hypothetical protein